MFFKTTDQKTAVEETPREPEYVFVRSWYTPAEHIRATAQGDHNALCGYEGESDMGEATVRDVLATLDRQHAGFYYCSKCVNIFAGVSIDEATAWRNKK